MKFLNLSSLLFFNVLITVNSFVPRLQALDANTDKKTLLSFKSSISDPSNALSDWNSISSHCSWFGVNCTKDSRIQSLQLSGLKLSGFLHPSLSNLTSLRVLDLSNNQFYGQISLDFLQLRHLRHIILAQNNLYGSIPSGLSNCHDLEEITLCTNHLTGALPYQLGNLSRLSIFNVPMNNLSGAIPPTYGNLSSLTVLCLAINNFTHTLPNELGRLKNLQVLQLSDNYFTGEIPHSIFNISSLVSISLTQNYLFFEYLTNCLQLEVLTLNGNNLTGQLPKSFSNLSTHLIELCIEDNFFTGGFPGLEKFENLTALAIQQNYFTGQIPHSVGKLRQLQLFLMNDNMFSGEIPDIFDNLPKLFKLRMDNNIFGYQDCGANTVLCWAHMLKYGLGGKVSTCGDVYSFGILLLEIFIAKKPTDRLFEGSSLVDFVSAKQQNVTDIIDPLLFKDNDFSIYSISTGGGNNSANNESSNWQRRIGECLASLIKMGLSCTADLPKDRLTMTEALTKLLDIRRSLLEL
ncbi:Leucine-rich repeat-containing N-terminal, plant-type [Dillenia turbinata]|uniref:Leucine-rich repeat-containing N-terminal, plant-type n=1 Tax=Dillenia turbinata TaxID=194707 RepID=A0AAN8ZJC2_9MAGN